MFVDGEKHSGVTSVTGNAIKRMISRDRVGTGGPAVAETPPPEAKIGTVLSQRPHQCSVLFLARTRQPN